MKKLFIPIVFFFALAAGIVFVAEANAATTQTINVSSDNKLDSKNPTTVYKNPNNIYIEIGKCFTYGEQTFRYLGKIDASSIDKSKDIQKAVFKIDRVSNSWDNDSLKYALHKVNNLYDQDTVTWNSMPSYEQTLESNGVLTNYGIFEFDITNLAKGWRDSTIANAGFLIKKQDEGLILSPSCIHGSFASTDYNGGETRPYLEITYYDPSITTAYPFITENSKIFLGTQFNVGWESKSVGSSVKIDLIDLNDNVVFSMDAANTGIAYSSFSNSNTKQGKYRIKIKHPTDSSVYAYTPYFFLSDSSDITPPSATTNISVFRDYSVVSAGALKFDFTLPQDEDIYNVNIYRSTVHGQLGTLVSFTSPGSNPGVAIIYPYVESNVTGKVYYTLRAVDLKSNESTNTDQYVYDFSTPVTTVTSPNGGEKFNAGSNQIIKWSTSNFGSLNVSIDLIDSTGYIKNIISNISNTGSYNWFIPSTTTGGYLDGYKYKILISSNDRGPSALDYSDTYFSIVETATTPSISPIITSFSPTSGLIGTRVKVYGNNFSSLNKVAFVNSEGRYHYTEWSPTSNTEIEMLMPSDMTVGQYYINLISPSGSAQSMQLFTVTASTQPTPSITVTSPNGGETLRSGDTIQIRWNSQGITGKVGIYIFDNRIFGSGSTNYVSFPSMDSLEVPAEQGYYNWTIPSLGTLPNGWGDGKNYKISISSRDNSNIYDSSDAPFSIVAANITTPSITVLSPNGGEKFIQGLQDGLQGIKWTGGKNKVQVGLVKPDYDPKTSSLILGWINLNSAPNSQVLWDGQYVTDLTGTVRWPVAPGSYKILLVSEDSVGNSCVGSSDGGCNSDSSDMSFSIVASSTATITPSIQLTENALVKSPDSPDVYVSKDGKKVKINSPEEFNQQGYKWDQIKTVQSDLLKQIEELKAEVKKLKEELVRAGVLLKARGSDDVYVIKDDKRIRIQSPEEFNQKGYKWDQIQEISSEELSSIPTLTSGITPSASEVSAYPNGTLIKTTNDPTVYVIINGKKRQIPDPASFNNWGYKWDQIKEVPVEKVGEFSEVSISSDIVRATGDTKIYRIIGDKKLWIPTVQAFLGSGYKPNSEIDISQDEFANFEDVKYIKAKGGTYVYEIKGDKKYRTTDTSQIQAQDIKTVTVAEFTAYPIGE